MTFGVMLGGDLWYFFSRESRVSLLLCWFLERYFSIFFFIFWLICLGDSDFCWLFSLGLISVTFLMFSLFLGES